MVLPLKAGGLGGGQRVREGVTRGGVVSAWLSVDYLVGHRGAVHGECTCARGRGQHGQTEGGGWGVWGAG